MEVSYRYAAIEAKDRKVTPENGPASFFVIGCRGPYSCSASPLIRLISERRFPLSFVMHLRFCSIMRSPSPNHPRIFLNVLAIHSALPWIRSHITRVPFASAEAHTSAESPIHQRMMPESHPSASMIMS